MKIKRKNFLSVPLSYAAVLLAVGAVLGGCTNTKRFEGQELTERAASLHTALESAHLTVTDNISGGVVQDITYRFAGDVMQYMYIGTDYEQNKTYYEFNNGTELDTITLPDDKEWSFAAKGSEDYYSYSRASRHYFADGSQLFSQNFEEGISGTEITDENGGKRLEISYSNEKLKVYETLTVTDMHKYYVFDADGYCTEFGLSYTDSDGSSDSYSTTIERRDPNEQIKRAEPELTQGGSNE